MHRFLKNASTGFTPSKLESGDTVRTASPSYTKSSSKQELGNEDKNVAVENHAPNANGISFPFDIHRVHTNNVPPAEVEPDSSGVPGAGAGAENSVGAAVLVSSQLSELVLHYLT